VLLYGTLIALVPSPVAFFLGFDQAGLLQYSHVVRDSGLRQVNTFFDITSAESDLFSDGAGAPDFQQLQDAAPGGVGDGLQETRKGLVLAGHELRNRPKIDGCQCAKV